MDADTAKKLREPFPAEIVGKLPRIWCGKCRNAQFKVCDQHQAAKCNTCNNKITTAHLHLDYVGHAAITDRLLQVDPGWSWEPVAFGPEGLPVLDKNGGLWIRLTVAGVTRLGYGDAEGKTGPSAVKEAIGDALRNGAMRFGVGLDLWHKDGQLVHDEEPAPIGKGEAPRNGQRPATNGTVEDNVTAARMSLAAHCDDMGYDLHAVAAKFREKYRQELGEATDPTRVRAFTKLLDGMPELDLKATA